MPRLTHPDLPGRVIDVDENKARNRRKSGWLDVLERPNESDPKDDWVAYAETQGVDVDGKTKQDLIDATRLSADAPPRRPGGRVVWDGARPR